MPRREKPAWRELTHRLAYAACVTLAATGVARAEPVPHVGRGRQEAAGDRERARQLYAEATRAYEATDYQAALDRLQAAYATYPTNRFLFNIGQAQRQLGACAEARETYLRFLSTETDLELRSRALVGLSRLSDCEPKGVLKPAAPARGPLREDAGALLNEAPAEPDRSPRARRMLAGWIASGALAGSTAIACGLMISSLRKLGDMGETKPVVPKTVHREEQRARALAIATDALGAATLIASGLSLYWTLSMPRSQARAADSTSSRAQRLHVVAAPLRLSVRLEL